MNTEYLILVTASYSDDSTLELKRSKCNSREETITLINTIKSDYANVISEDFFKDEDITLFLRVYELNEYNIPKLVESSELTRSNNVPSVWTGWSFEL
jgi:hypothetical protein